MLKCGKEDQDSRPAKEGGKGNKGGRSEGQQRILVMILQHGIDTGGKAFLRKYHVFRYLQEGWKILT